MGKYSIELTQEEAEIVKFLGLSPSNRAIPMSDPAQDEKRALIPKLMHFLLSRGEIPQGRLYYWQDPRFNSSNNEISYKGVFERNGTRGDGIYRHPHFDPFLCYFLFGPDLPGGVVSAFESKIHELAHNMQSITSGDVVPLGKFARQLTRDHQLSASAASEEFFKLCVDLGVDRDYARSIRDIVKKTR